MIDRQEIQRWKDVELLVRADGIRQSISDDWRRGRAGKMTDVYDLALVMTEAHVRGLPLHPLEDVRQMRLFDVDRHGDLAS